jgi:hypothetical protein
MVDFDALNRANERRRGRYSLHARYVLLSRNAKLLIDTLGGILQNDPHDRGENYNDATIDSWASEAEHVSRLLNADFDALLTETAAWLEKAKLETPPKNPPGVKTCGSCVHVTSDRAHGSGTICAHAESHLAGHQVVNNTLACEHHRKDEEPPL